MRDFIRQMVYDGGVFIFSLRLNELSGKEMDLVPSDLLESIKLLKATVAEECQCPETSPFNFPRTNEMGFMDFLLEYLMDLTQCEAGLVTLANYPVKTIREELYDLHLFLGKIVELGNEDVELQAVWDRAIEVAYKVEFLIDSLMIGDNLDYSSISFHSIVEEIKIIKAMAAKINFDSKRLPIKVEETTKRLNHMPSQGSETIIHDVVVGLKDEATSVIDRLTRGPHQVRIVPIIGMPGLGKTTLAKKVYNDSKVMSHFYIRAWCTVSQMFRMKNLLLEILTCVHPKLPNGVFEMSEEDLALKVKQSLQRNKYLIVLDDVWDIEVWNRLEASFPDDLNGSRVILTSRCRDVFPEVKLDKEPHSLRPLTHAESWDLLKEKLYPGKDLPPSELCALRMQIVEMCRGLPLTIVILAGILAKKDKYGWKEVVESLSSSAVSATEQCIAALELSYGNLPDKLKPCFLYFGAFPEDHEHTIDRLIWLWVAEGFARKPQVASSKDMLNAQKSHFKSSEDEANYCLSGLVERSLVMVSQQSSTGGIKTCRIHDLLHEFCVRKAEEEKFLLLVRGYDELYTTNVPHNLRRLCINAKQEDFYKASLFAPTIRCLLFFNSSERYQQNNFQDCSFDASFIIGVFKLVRVLDLSQLYLGFTFPRELELLVQLRFLAVLGDMKSIPSSIANLSNLETFIVETIHTDLVKLPDTIWNLKKLRHLQIKNKIGNLGNFELPTNDLEDAAELCDLDSFGRGVLSSWEHMDKIFSKFPNIRKMKFSLWKRQEDSEYEDSEDEDSTGDASSKILVFDSLSRLESLSLGAYPMDEFRCQCDFQFSSTIKKLALFGFGLPWSKISTIANLPNLQVLKLFWNSFKEEVWNMELERFPKLRFLKLANLDIVKWTGSECENCLPLLEKLVLQSCDSLEEIPTSLGNVSTLEIIEVHDCFESANLVQEIQEEYPDLKILVSSQFSSRN